MRRVVEQMRLLKEAFLSIRPMRKIRKIDSLDELVKFCATRAAFISQKTLFGYVKTRMGTRYPEMFRDPAIIHSVNIAKMHHFAACLSDLTVFLAAHALDDDGFDDEARRRLATYMFEHGIAGNLETSVDEFDPDAAREAFRQRLSFLDWSGSFDIRDVFTQSPQSIIRWAPIAEELKAFDKEIVENSVRFAWIDVRKQFEKHFVADAARADIHTAALAGETAPSRP